MLNLKAILASGQESLNTYLLRTKVNPIKKTNLLAIPDSKSLLIVRKRGKYCRSKSQDNHLNLRPRSPIYILKMPRTITMTNFNNG
jgi:hypothetical protein